MTGRQRDRLGRVFIRHDRLRIGYRSEADRHFAVREGSAHALCQHINHFAGDWLIAEGHRSVTWHRRSGNESKPRHLQRTRAKKLRRIARHHRDTYPNPSTRCLRGVRGQRRPADATPFGQAHEGEPGRIEVDAETDSDFVPIGIHLDHDGPGLAGADRLVNDPNDSRPRGQHAAAGSQTKKQRCQTPSQVEQVR